VWYISDTANIQINDDATTTSSAKVPGIKKRTGLKCRFTGTHRSQRNNLRMMKKVIVLLIVITVTFFLSFINQFLTRRQYASHYIITPGSKTSNKKNNTKQILMIYIHFFDNDILTFHYSTPFSNYESL
jgi:Mg2+ and Co2+ transporter CorA